MLLSLIVPVAGSGTSFGISITMSGLKLQPFTQATGAGASLASPSIAPPSTHVTSVLMVASLSVRSFAKWLYPGSANHGGIRRDMTAFLMAFAQGRTSLYVSKD